MKKRTALLGLGAVFPSLLAAHVDGLVPWLTSGGTPGGRRKQGTFAFRSTTSLDGDVWTIEPSDNPDAR